jgi:hypothetical protein
MGVLHAIAKKAAAWLLTCRGGDLPRSSPGDKCAVWVTWVGWIPCLRVSFAVGVRAFTPTLMQILQFPGFPNIPRNDVCGNQQY